MAPDTTTDRVATAAVLADGVFTRYVRRGSGPAVLLLGGDPALAQALACWFRVIAPEVPGERPGPSVGWLRGLVDGLGLPEVAILTSPALAEAALDFAREEPERVKGAVLLPGPGETELAQCCRALTRLFQ